jgi:hypothetical protein
MIGHGIGQGMVRSGRCRECGALLMPDDGERCAGCRPRLNVQAAAIGAWRRQCDDEIAALERAAEHLHTVIKQVERKLNRAQRWSRTHSHTPKS